MKKIMLLLVVVSIHFSAFPQTMGKTINISKDIELIKLNDHAYVYMSYCTLPDYGRIGANGLILVNHEEAFLFDSPWNDSLTSILINYLNDSLNVRVVGFVPNHWHVDCMGGLGYLQRQNIESYANQMTIDIARSKGLALPEHGFKDSLQLYLGDQLICCYYLGAAHSLDNIVVWIPAEQLLFAGCMVKTINSTNLGNTVDGDLVAYPKTIESLMKKFPTAKVVIPGHGHFGGMDLVKHTLEMATRQLKN